MVVVVHTHVYTKKYEIIGTTNPEFDKVLAV